MIVKLFKKYCKKLVVGIIGILILTTILNYARSLVPLFISKIFNIINSEASSTLPNYLEKIFVGKEKETQLLLVMVSIIIVGFIRDTLNLTDDILIGYVGEKIGYNIQIDFYKKVQTLPYSYLNHCETGDLIQRSTNDVNRVKTLLGNQLPELLNNVLKIIIYTTQMIIISWKLGLIVASFIPINIIIGFVYFKKMRPTFNQIEEDDGALSTVVQENLTGIRVVKAFANERLEINKERKAMNGLTNTWAKLMDSQSTYWATGDLICYGMMLIVFVVGVVLIKSNELSMDSVLAIILLVEYVMFPTRQVGRLISEFGRTGIAAGRILEVVNNPSEFEIADGTLKPDIKGNIEFKNVSFKFSDSNIPTLNNISFSIKKGETVALIGKTGCGKSTLISLLNRMLEPTSGEILFDGIDSKNINKKYLRSNVGVVLQESFLFSTTIAENIGITREHPSNEEIKRVADVAAVSADIEKFENKYETIVGERGVTLSGGQKQRISIARMLLNKKPILIFDDSLSAVDTETDKRIRESITKKDKEVTTIIITHRVVTAKDADKIIIIENGKITNIGTHDELIKIEGLYKKIWNIQSCLEGEGE